MGAADLVVRGGRVVDGTGLAGYTADVEVRDGRISRIGRIDEDAREVVDADGLVVAPGFVDIHTHYDAQAHFEPTMSPSSWHGVTTVLDRQLRLHARARRSPPTSPGSSTCCRAVEGM